MNRLILASASPRRRELLTQVGFVFEVMPSDKEECMESKEPQELAEGLSRQKALDIYEKIQTQGSVSSPDEEIIVIGADTIVVHRGNIMGKPRNAEEAEHMLGQLQGESHLVYTGVTLVFGGNGREEIRSFHECTQVTFYEVGEDEIKAYVRTGEPMDKAGAYGIQGLGALFVRGISGDYNNVVGLPIARLYQEIKKGKGQRKKYEKGSNI